MGVSRRVGHGVLLGKLLSPSRSAMPRGVFRDGWQRNRNDIRSREYDEDAGLRFLVRSETVVPRGARPNKVDESLLKTWVGR